MSSSEIASPSRLSKGDEITFSPVIVRQSPVSRTPQRGNLTGNPRTVRDNVADLYNLIQKWNAAHLAGADILAKIHALKIAAMEPVASEERDIYPDGIQYYCDLLENTCKDLSSIVMKMQLCAKQLRAMCELENYQHRSRRGAEDTEPTPMFLTWPVERFGEVSSDIVSQYAAELEVKNSILEGVCHCTTREALLFHVAAWAHQPAMVNENATRNKLEAMLIETGHR
ncbi:cyclin-dependent kinase 2-interacting protein [Ischnura elegans]|uniref:cyclin-dependent kinase 2-interacting protein n=1 Tax=Ischnura elegans TaxID=197161 RepID=UPI001ED87AC0|nr:cyclin-dependent kinase 2-interacting protein [Ischnura elegans]XP_046384209.1 cyclin-dependent kinase 2-interacting protein [Ischnura elegans]XP_046384210.1 cyclin-dependent kinase 2-interacting protein [Ischnura elegans]XP_046384211.1 cyclin-dependent kinase 2-interacting protein [Ischnura elegans]